MNGRSAAPAGEAGSRTGPFRPLSLGGASASAEVVEDGPLAQLAEQQTFNPRVVGSSPTGPTAGIPYRQGIPAVSVGEIHSPLSARVIKRGAKC